MAFKSFTKLSPRNQSSLISQLHKMLNYYSSIFSTRERIYLKRISQHDGSIYWLEDDTKKLAASAILDPNYVFSLGPIKLHSLGHTVSKRPGLMDRLLSHIFGDHAEKSIMFLCKPFVADSISADEFELKQITPTELMELCPDLASHKTDYFNVKNEPLAQAMDRKGHHIYFRFSIKDKELLKKHHKNLWQKLFG
jgi:hypothetical protein